MEKQCVLRECYGRFHFYRIVRAFVGFLRQNNVRIVSYVDDFILAAGLSEIEGQRDFVLNKLKKFGFNLNEKKSQLSPSIRKKFIGFVVETHASAEHVKISIPKDRINTVKKDIRRALRQGVVTARFLARIAGQLVSMTKAIIPTKLLLRNVHRLLSLKKDWQAPLNVSIDVKNGLVWWLEAFRPLERKSLKSLSSRMGDSGN